MEFHSMIYLARSSFAEFGMDFNRWPGRSDDGAYCLDAPYEMPSGSTMRIDCKESDLEPFSTPRTCRRNDYAPRSK